MNNPNRVTKGVPTGGQYAEKKTPEADVALGGPDQHRVGDLVRISGEHPYTPEDGMVGTVTSAGRYRVTIETADGPVRIGRSKLVAVPDSAGRAPDGRQLTDGADDDRTLAEMDWDDDGTVTTYTDLENAGVDLHEVGLTDAMSVASTDEILEAHRAGVGDREWEAYSELRSWQSHRNLCEARNAGIDLRIYSVATDPHSQTDDTIASHQELVDAANAGIRPGNYSQAREVLSHEEIMDLHDFKQVDPARFAAAFKAMHEVPWRQRETGSYGDRLDSPKGRDLLGAAKVGCDLDEYAACRAAGLDDGEALLATKPVAATERTASGER